LLARFEDKGRGGFFFTSHDHEKLFHRTKPGHDNATPSGNGIAAQALVALGQLASQPRYVEAAQRAVDVFAADVARAPDGHSTLLEAAAMLDAPPAVVVLVGDVETCATWRRALASIYRPGTMAIDVSGVADVPAPLVKGAAPASGATAYVCHGATCLPPMRVVDEVLAALDRGVR